MKFFTIAKRLSKHSDYETHRLGAVIVYGNKILGMGFNKRKTHPRSKTRFQNCHAELCAILNAREDLSNSELYVYREHQNGSVAMSRPCQACMTVISEAGIKKIHYTDYNCYKTEEVNG